MKYFGTDGIRGKAYKTLPLLRATQLGYAINKIFSNKNVVVGFDTRESSKDYLNAFLKGLEEDNYQVAGVVTTPMIAYYSKIKSCIGIMITASHNPYYDNGLKVFFNGEKLKKDLIYKIEHEMEKKQVFSSELKKYNVSKNIEIEYLSYIKKK